MKLTCALVWCACVTSSSATSVPDLPAPPSRTPYLGCIVAWNAIERAWDCP